MRKLDHQFRVGVIGCGRVSPRHLDSLRELPNARVVAVSDVIEARAARAAKDHDAAIHTEYRKLLDRPDVDVVNICTPSGMHASMAIEALQAGKHVLVEKPIALSLHDADRMIGAAASCGRRLGVVLQNRYNPPMQELRRVVDDGRLGRLLLGSVTVRWFRSQEYYDDGWHGTLAMDGGSLMNQSIHHIDALQWMMGPVESVSAYTATLAHRIEVEDVAVATVRFRGGALGVIESSTVTYPENLEGSLALFGEKGSVKVGGTALNRKVLWKIAGELEHERDVLVHDEIDPPSIYGYSHKAVIAEFLSAVREDREPATPGHEARKSVALVLAMYQSAREGRSVLVDPSIWSEESELRTGSSLAARRSL